MYITYVNMKYILHIKCYVFIIIYFSSSETEYAISLSYIPNSEHTFEQHLGLLELRGNN